VFVPSNLLFAYFMLLFTVPAALVIGLPSYYVLTHCRRLSAFWVGTVEFSEAPASARCSCAASVRPRTADFRRHRARLRADVPRPPVTIPPGATDSARQGNGLTGLRAPATGFHAMKLAIIPVTPFQQNCSLVVCEATGDAALVDPGGDVERLLAAVEKSGARLAKILVTHGHVDHCGGVAEIARARACRSRAAARGRVLDRPARAAGPQLRRPRCTAVHADRWLEGGDTVTVGDIRFDVRHCPDTRRATCVRSTRARIAFVGDVLFQGSVGRTDFPRAISTRWCARSRRSCGPGRRHPVRSRPRADVTFGDERRSNPFVGDAALQALTTAARDRAIAHGAALDPGAARDQTSSPSRQTARTRW